MNRKAISVIGALAIALIGLADASAQERKAPPQKALTSFGKLEFKSATAKAKKAGRIAKPSVAAPQASAPALSRVIVFAVASTQYGDYEYMTTPNQFSTVADHGGPEMIVVTQEIGYGSNPVATMAGAVLPRLNNVLTQSICVTNGIYTNECTAGQTIVGFFRYWDVSGYQSGQFTYRNTSSNSPFNTMGTMINIR